MKPADRRFFTESEGVLIAKGDANFSFFIAQRWIDGAFKQPVIVTGHDIPLLFHHPKLFAFFRKQLGVISMDLNIREKIRLKLKEQDAAALRSLGYDLDAHNIVAWRQLEIQPTLLFGGSRVGFPD